MTAKTVYQNLQTIDTILLAMRVNLSTLNLLSDGICSSPDLFDVSTVSDLSHHYSSCLLQQIDELFEVNFDLLRNFREASHDAA